VFSSINFRLKTLVLFNLLVDQGLVDIKAIFSFPPLLDLGLIYFVDLDHESLLMVSS